MRKRFRNLSDRALATRPQGLVALLLLLFLSPACGADSRPVEPELPRLPGLPESPALDGDRIRPFPQNPYYWQYRGEPVILIGGSDEDNLFNHPHLPPHGLEAHLDLLASVGGNYVRNTMSNRDEGNIWPFGLAGDGRYDLNTWNAAYWDQFEAFLEMTHARDIIVQIEIWDRFDFAREPWRLNPFNPANNINYEAEEVGLPTVVNTHPGRKENPFFRSTPAQENNQILLAHQRALVEKLLSLSLPFPHVLYTVSNETNESPQWSAFWADLIRLRGAEAGHSVQVTEMWDAWDLDDPMHAYTFDDPERYTFGDISQNNHQEGQRHWDRAQEQRARIASASRPLNNVKIYGGPTFGGSFEEGTRKLWRNLFGGMASIRFHRPGGHGNYGIGLNGLAQAHIRSARMLTEEMNFFEAQPRSELLSDRTPDEAYAVAKAEEAYAVYFPDGGSVILDPGGSVGPMNLKWMEVLESRWGDDRSVEGGGPIRLTAPGRGPWVAFLQVQHRNPKQ